MVFILENAYNSHACNLRMDYKFLFDHKAKAQEQFEETNSATRIPKSQSQRLSEYMENTCL